MGGFSTGGKQVNKPSSNYHINMGRLPCKNVKWELSKIAKQSVVITYDVISLVMTGNYLRLIQVYYVCGIVDGAAHLSP